jgi:hypothetical protein
VFDRIKYPYFKTDGCFFIRDNDVYEFQPDRKPSYGGHDIRFGIEARQNGFTIKKVDDLTCMHLELEQFGKPGTNTGCHTIRYHKTIEHQNEIPNFTMIGLDK